MSDTILDTPPENAIPIYPVASDALEDGLNGLSAPMRKFASASDFKGEAGEIVLLPDADGALAGVMLGMGADTDPWLFAGCAEALPPGDYKIAGGYDAADADAIALFWILGTYRFTRYRKNTRKNPRLAAPKGANLEEARRLAKAVFLARDLINTSAEDMGPHNLQAAVEAVGGEYGASVKTIAGDDLLKENFPMIHAVGRAAAKGREPRLIDLQWGDESAPKLTLVGKGVCFDTGGLNIKPASSSRLMKKDMGGSANALATARLVMEAGLNVRLRLLIPAVENNIDGSAYRPGDVLTSRKGLTVEVDNTDAEGRLVLGDALALAAEESPDLIIDFATLTGAARVALGPQLAPYYTDSQALSGALETAASDMRDPVWRMPLHRPYMQMLDSPIADMVNSASGSFAGSITAALFLSRFAGEGNWMHFDIYGWNAEARPGRPAGGEAQGPRAVYSMLKTRYG